MLTVKPRIVKRANVKGKGGKEEEILALFKDNLKRVSASLYDAENKRTGKKYEFKKQAKDQWFDISKYQDLSRKDKAIIMTFILHNEGEIDKIGVLTLGKFLNRLLGDKRYDELGWTETIMRQLNRVKKKAPQFQAKVKLDVRKFVEDNDDIVNIIFNRE